MARVSAARNPEYADLRRAQLCAAALRAIARKGLGAVTLRDIGEEAGMSPGIVSYYFESKEGAITSALRAMSSASGRSVQQKVDEGVGARETLEFAGTALFRSEAIEGISDLTEVCRLALEFWTAAASSEVVRQTLQSEYAAMDERITAVIRRGQAEGEIKRQLDAPEEARLFRFMLAGQVVDFMLDARQPNGPNAFETIASTIGDYLGRRLYQDP